MALTSDIRDLVRILDEEGFGAMAGELMTELSLGRPVEKEQEDDEPPARQPIADEEQIAFAIDFLRQRLVMPIAAFAEAETIAAEMSNGEPVKIEFVDPLEGTIAEPISRGEAGDASMAGRIDNFLGRLPTLITADRNAK